MRDFYDNFTAFKHGIITFAYGFFSPSNVHWKFLLTFVNVLVQAGVTRGSSGAILSTKARKAIYLYTIMHFPIHKSHRYLYPCLFGIFSCTFV